MATIHKPDNKPLQSNSGLMVPSRYVPSFRVCQAHERGSRSNLLLRMHGGLGDIVCAEPAVRYALKYFKDVKFTLATLYPGLFQHLKFHEVYDNTNAHELAPHLDKYLLYENTDTTNELAAEFICHTLMHGIDYASLYMWRCLLPRADREIKLVPTTEEYAFADQLIQPNDVLVHPGKTWQSRTYPKNWWDRIIAGIIKGGGRPIIVGGVVDQGRASTVDVDIPEGSLDMRYKTTMMQSVAMMHRAKVLLTNDSAPLHMATTGDAWIGFLSTVKQPDHLLTYRHGIWAWRMKDLALGGYYQLFDICPNKEKTIRVDDVDIQDLLKWLPEPKVVSDWALDKLR